MVQTITSKIHSNLLIHMTLYWIFWCKKRLTKPFIEFIFFNRYSGRERDKVSTQFSDFRFFYPCPSIPPPFPLPSQRNFPIYFKPKVAIAEFFWKMQKKSTVIHFGVGRHASFPHRIFVKILFFIFCEKMDPITSKFQNS